MILSKGEDDQIMEQPIRRVSHKETGNESGLYHSGKPSEPRTNG